MKKTRAVLILITLAFSPLFFTACDQEFLSVNTKGMEIKYSSRMLDIPPTFGNQNQRVFLIKTIAQKEDFIELMRTDYFNYHSGKEASFVQEHWDKIYEFDFVIGLSEYNETYFSTNNLVFLLNVSSSSRGNTVINKMRIKNDLLYIYFDSIYDVNPFLPTVLGVGFSYGYISIPKDKFNGDKVNIDYRTVWW